MNVQIEWDKISMRNFDKTIKDFQKEAPNWTFKGLCMFLLNAKANAQNKLKFDSHIVTARLRNSIFVMASEQKNVDLPNNQRTYKDNNGKLFDAPFEVELSKHEAAIGTNVEYAPKIEYKYDSFLYWGVKNADDAEFVKAFNREMSKKKVVK